MMQQYIYSVIFLLFSLSFFAQGKDSHKKIKTLKVSFLQDQLNLSAEENSKFWPLYNSYDDKKFELRDSKMQLYRKNFNKQKIDSLSEKEAITLLSKIHDIDKELYELKQKYTAGLKKIFPPKKILKLKNLEYKFKRNLLKQYRKKKYKNGLHFNSRKNK
jgi:hypothetical protein